MIKEKVSYSGRVAWIPRSANKSSTSRRLRLKRKYNQTAYSIISGGKRWPLKKASLKQSFSSFTSKPVGDIGSEPLFVGSRTVGARPDRTLSEWYQRQSQQGLSENRQSENCVARAGEADGADRSNFPLTA